jgi:hypothetical protein
MDVKRKKARKKRREGKGKTEERKNNKGNREKISTR